MLEHYHHDDDHHHGHHGHDHHAVKTNGDFAIKAVVKFAKEVTLTKDVGQHIV